MEDKMENKVSDESLLVLSRLVKWDESTEEATSLLKVITADLIATRECLKEQLGMNIDLNNALSALQEQVRWIPCSERFPTVADCPNEKELFVIARIKGRLYGIVEINQFAGYPYDEWKKIDLPLPPEEK
jgi:hypothetical protein